MKSIGFPPTNETATIAVHRRIYLTATLFYIAGLGYGSWLPFELRPHLPGEIEQQLAVHWHRPLLWSTGADFLGNAVLGVPLGFLLSGTLRSPRRFNHWRWLPTLALSGAVSFSVELVQLWCRHRVASQEDVAAQFGGAVVGCLLEYLCGASLAKQLARIQGQAGTTEAWRRLSRLYVIAYFLYALLPLGGLESPAEVRRRWHEFSTTGASPSTHFTTVHAGLEYVKKSGVYAPLGVAIYLARRRSSLRRTLLVAAAVGACMAAFIETAQLLLHSSNSALADVVCAALGSAGGAVFACRLWSVASRSATYPSVRPNLRRAAAIASVGYLGMLAALYWYPLQFAMAPEIISERMLALKSWPLAALWQGGNANATAQITIKISTFGILGGLLAVFYACADHPSRFSLFQILLLTFIAGLTIELGQIWSPQHYPDAFDAVLAAVGGLCGHQLVRLLLPRELTAC